MTGRSRSAVVGLERLERLVAVHARHHDVEQDDVDRRRRPVAQHVERLAAVARLERLVADALEQADAAAAG